jgi:hypothetical protein
MAFYFQQIIAATFVPNANTTMFTGPVNSQVRIDALTVTNIDSVAHTITIHLVPSGGSVASGNTTTFAQQVQAGQTWVSPNEVGKVLGAGDFISAIASAASQLVMSAGGIVQA